jgi:hypothetical protein
MLETDDNVVLAVENRDESNFRPLPFEILSSPLGMIQYRSQAFILLRSIADPGANRRVVGQ